MSNFVIAAGHTASGNIGCGVVANQYAAKICLLLSEALKIPNRGVKTKSLIVLNRTVMLAILVECLFADSSDSNKYNPDIIAKAIANGIVGVGSFNGNENSNSGNGEQVLESSWKLGWNRNNIGWWLSTDNINKIYYTSQNGSKCINGEWYIFDENGYALKNAWYYDESDCNWYYLDENCMMVYGSKNKPLWKWIDDGCYAFDEEGRMYCDCFTPDGWRVDDSGMWIK